MNDNKNSGARISVGIIILIIILTLIVGILTCVIIYNKKSGKIVTQENKIVSIQIDELLESASELVSLKYYYTDADTFTRSKKAFGKKIPFTTDEVVFKYSGIVSAGINISEVKYEIDEDRKTITLTIPQPAILSHEIDENSFEFYDVKNSVFTETKLEDYTTMIADLKEEKEEYLYSDGEFFESVTENAEDVLKKFVTAPSEYKDYKVIFEHTKTSPKPGRSLYITGKLYHLSL